MNMDACTSMVPDKKATAVGVHFLGESENGFVIPDHDFFNKRMSIFAPTSGFISIIL